MILTAAAGAILGGAAIRTGGSLFSSLNQYGLNAQEQAYKLEQMEKQYGYDTALKEQQYGYDTALSRQNAEQELNKQINQQNFDKLMSDTEYQRKIADMKAAGVNPALALEGGGVSGTNATAQAQAQQAGQIQLGLNQTTNAFKDAIMNKASKHINSLAEKLTKDPSNKKYQSEFKTYMKEIINIIK